MYDKPCVAALAAALCVGAHGTVLDLSGAYTSDYDYTATADTRSRAIDLKRSCTATFGDCDVSAKFEGPGGRFVSGGALVFNGGSYDFATNITSKMTAAYYPTGLRAVRADSSITIRGGRFKADLPLADSEIFTNDSDTGTFVSISGGDVVSVGVRTREGLSYQLLSATGIALGTAWTPKGEPVAGTGSAMRLQCPRTTEAQAFYKVRATD